MFLNFSIAFFLIAISPSLHSENLLPKKKPVVRNFMVTECKKGVCLMKMRPHEKRIDKSGQVYWVKIQ